MFKVLLTGASGYLGGEVLHQLATGGSDKYEIVCVVRDHTKSNVIKKAYPDVRIVEGDLDNTKWMEDTVKSADIVLHFASTKHAPSSEAIAKGLSEAASRRQRPSYWVQISGSSLFCRPDIKANSYGEAGEKVYDDIKDQDEIWSLIQDTPARVVEQLMLSQDPTKVKTALIVGPLIYGTGQGPVNTRSMQGPGMTQYALQNGHAFHTGKGESAWSNIHVHDIGKLVVALVEAARSGATGLWNKEGVYCPENGIMSFGDLARLIAKSAKDQGYIKTDEVESLDAERTNEVMPRGAVLVGANARQTSSRAQEKLGWKPSGPSLADFAPEGVRLEAARLGLST